MPISTTELLRGNVVPAQLVDLNPLDVSDPDAMAWLENLVWPEHDDRRRPRASRSTVHPAPVSSESRWKNVIPAPRP